LDAFREFKILTLTQLSGDIILSDNSASRCGTGLLGVKREKLNFKNCLPSEFFTSSVLVKTRWGFCGGTIHN